jgi:hypothetical protein
MNWIKVPNSQFIRILEKCPDRVSNQGSIGHILSTPFSNTLCVLFCGEIPRFVLIRNNR